MSPAQEKLLEYIRTKGHLRCELGGFFKTSGSLRKVRDDTLEYVAATGELAKVVVQGKHLMSTLIVHRDALDSIREDREVVSVDCPWMVPWMVPWIQDVIHK